MYIFGVQSPLKGGGGDQLMSLAENIKGGEKKGENAEGEKRKRKN